MTGSPSGAMGRKPARVSIISASISPGAIPRFMARFEEVYGKLGKFERVLAAGPMHHRLLWIHPFADGNGRVTRLMSYAVLRSALDTGGLWSISRGLARSFEFMLVEVFVGRGGLLRRLHHDHHYD